jgi:regulatory protein
VCRVHQQPSRQPKRSAEATPRTRALRLLARRDHTRAELERKLAPHVEDASALAALLDEFVENGWLSEARVAEQVVNSKRSRYGPARIRQILVGKGVAPDVIESELVSVRDGEAKQALAVWSRKFGTLPQSPAERAKQVRFLQARGYSFAVAMRVVRGDVAESC